jgi:hypothetical protein
VTGDTLIALGIGCWAPINKLDGEICGLIYGDSGKGDVELGGLYSGKLTKEDAEIWEIELEDGKKLKCTPDHKILTKKGYIELQQLTLCDMVAVANMELSAWNINFTSEKNSI